MERLWQVTGCAEPLRRVRWSDTLGYLPRRRYSSPQDEVNEENRTNGVRTNEVSALRVRLRPHRG